MTAPIPTAPTHPDLMLTQQTSQYDQVPLSSHKGVLASNAKVAPKAKQAEINSMAYLKTNMSSTYTRP